LNPLKNKNPLNNNSKENDYKIKAFYKLNHPNESKMIKPVIFQNAKFMKFFFTK
jgi:hypothetical protein